MNQNNAEFSTKESLFTQLMENDVHSMWLQRKQNAFSGKDGVKIQWISVTNPINTRCIVIVNGRNESFWKYQEIFFEFSRQGYDVYAYDHRGQGASGRLTADPELGHVNSFDDYVDDLQEFVTKVVEKEKDYQHRFLLAHSMGGAITTLYLEKYTSHFDAVVLNAPMFGIHMPVPLKLVASSIAKIMEHYQDEPSYVLGQKPYHEEPFENNALCQSKLRYVWAKHLYQIHPELRIGGPSPRWLWQAIQAADHCIRDVGKIEIPVLLLQAGSDTVVDNNSHQRFCGQNKHCNLKVIRNARHEILMEKDVIRNQALCETLAFFNQFIV